MQIRGMSYNTETNESRVEVEVPTSLNASVQSLSQRYRVTLEGPFTFDSDELYEATAAALEAAGVNVLPFEPPA